MYPQPRDPEVRNGGGGGAASVRIGRIDNNGRHGSNSTPETSGEQLKPNLDSNDPSESEVHRRNRPSVDSPSHAVSTPPGEKLTRWCTSMVSEMLKSLRSPIPPGHERIEWTCSCGRRLYGDYPTEDMLESPLVRALPKSKVTCNIWPVAPRRLHDVWVVEGVFYWYGLWVIITLCVIIVICKYRLQSLRPSKHAHVCCSSYCSDHFGCFSGGFHNANEYGQDYHPRANHIELRISSSQRSSTSNCPCTSSPDYVNPVQYTCYGTIRDIYNGYKSGTVSGSFWPTHPIPIVVLG
jgi:hypothetical protein